MSRNSLLISEKGVTVRAVLASAAAIILMHNHPSGESTPSEADIKVTRDLIRGIPKPNRQFPQLYRILDCPENVARYTLALI
jgi:hypothetical protein